MVNLCIEINTTSAQILRHRSFSFQEFSQRYASLDTLNVSPDDLLFDLRRQDLNNRQNSIDNIEDDLKEKYKKTLEEHFENGLSIYRDMIKDGIAKECARNILPMSSPT